MVLGFMTKFPWGEPTLFSEKILHGAGWGSYIEKEGRLTQILSGNQSIYKGKIHTMRIGQRWKEGMIIHMATGVRTKKYHQFNKDIPELQRVKSVQRIDIIHRGPDCCMIFIDKELKYCRLRVPLKTLATLELKPGIHVHGFVWFKAFLENDGLTEEQFWKFFKKRNLRNGQLIHWTDKKY